MALTGYAGIIGEGGEQRKHVGARKNIGLMRKGGVDMNEADEEAGGSGGGSGSGGAKGCVGGYKKMQLMMKAVLDMDVLGSRVMEMNGKRETEEKMR